MCSQQLDHVVDAVLTVALPLIVIGGYLGAGKTTLVNHLLRHAGGRRIAVLVNDFGDVDIDADLIAGSVAEGSAGCRADVLSLAGGCLCCSFGNDLVGMLQALQQRSPAPDLVLIELSGVAVPAAVRQTAGLVLGVDVQGTWVLVDAADVRRQAADRYVGGTVLQQLQQADRVLINKPDLVDAATLQALTLWLADAAPGAHVEMGAVAELAPEWVLGWQGPSLAPLEGPPNFAGRATGAAHRSADAVFASRSAVLADGMDLTALAQVLVEPARGVLRAKALVRDAAGRGQLLQLAGGRWAVTPVVVQGAGRLVLIGLRGSVDAADFALPGLTFRPLRRTTDPHRL